MNIAREDVEKELTFLGFLIMQNKLKSATIKALAELNEADIRTIMATGDNMLTAISVGRKCGIVQEEQTVYLADLVFNNKTKQEELHWSLGAKTEQTVADSNVNAINRLKTTANENLEVLSLVPWEKDGSTNHAIAITGKAFNYLI
jgi:cation-transporting ATPase 13A2